jgi:hypothetical protein
MQHFTNLIHVLTERFGMTITEPKEAVKKNQRSFKSEKGLIRV